MLIGRSIPIKRFHIDSQDDVYDILDIVGTGGWGKVYKAKNQNNKIVSLKFFGYTENKPDIHVINNEIMLMISLLKVEGIVQIESLFYDSAPGLVPGKNPLFLQSYPVIVMEMLSGGELLEKIDRRVKLKQKISEIHIANLFGGVIRAIESLHRRNYIHRDLKLQNLIYASVEENSPMKIVDFGCMIQLSEGQHTLRTNPIVGTAGYFAPETLERGEYSYKTDVWQAGCILYAILCGYPPFHPEQTKKDYILVGKFVECDEWDNLSVNAKNLIKSMLCVNPSNRISIDGILKHTWMTGGASDRQLGKEYARKIGVLSIREKLRNIFSQENIEKLATIFNQENNDQDNINEVEEFEDNLSLLPRIQDPINHTFHQLSNTSQNHLSSLPIPSIHYYSNTTTTNNNTNTHSNQNSIYSYSSYSSSGSTFYSENHISKIWFNRFDKNGDGKITREEFQEGIFRMLVKDHSFLEQNNSLSNNNHNCNDNSTHHTPLICPHTSIQVQELFLAIDRHKTGDIDFEDFAHFYEMIMYHTEMKKIYETQFIKHEHFDEHLQDNGVNPLKRKISSIMQDTIIEENEENKNNES